MAKLCRVPPATRKVNDWLIKSSSNVTSQGGEDGVLEQIFQILPEHDSPKWCVEFGAWDGVHLSNTWNLLNKKSWHGVLIEADEQRFKQLQNLYSNNGKVICLQEFVTFEGPKSLDSLLASQELVPTHLDLISIDIDGADYHIWDTLKKYTPRVVVIEFNPTIPNNVVYIQDKDINVYQGSSLAALVELGKQKSYELVSTTTFNAIFVQSEYFPLFKIEDNSLDKMHDVPMPTEFFQLYDGTIKITGCKKLIWKKVPIREADLQVIPESKRLFPYVPPSCNIIENADKYFEECVKSSSYNPDYFLDKGKLAFRKYPDEDVIRVLKYCVTAPGPIKSEYIDKVIETLLQFGEALLVDNENQRSVKWFKCVLYFDQISDQNLKSLVMGKLGEAYIRVKKYEKAHFWLNLSLNFNSDNKSSLKSLAKLLSKQGKKLKCEEIVERLRTLNTTN